MEWVRGDFLISEITLNRFFALHVVALPLVLVMLVFVHIVALHHVGSNNPDGIDIRKHKDYNGVPLDSIPFHPYYTIGHDVPATVLFLIVFCVVVFYAPEMGGYFLEAPNFEHADPLKTPDHIVPVWYYTPFYAMLRAATYPFLGIDAKFWGFVVMAGAIVVPAVLPWLDRSPVKSIRYKGLASKVMLGVFVISFFILGYLGTIPPSPFATALAQICTLLYFAYFVLMPWYTRAEKTKPVPERV
jgi:ubiquinol-cytochrome c reductase cytochrome b subunit